MQLLNTCGNYTLNFSNFSIDITHIIQDFSSFIHTINLEETNSISVPIWSAISLLCLKIMHLVNSGVVKEMYDIIVNNNLMQQRLNEQWIELANRAQEIEEFRDDILNQLSLAWRYTLRLVVIGASAQFNIFDNSPVHPDRDYTYEQILRCYLEYIIELRSLFSQYSNMLINLQEHIRNIENEYTISIDFEFPMLNLNYNQTFFMNTVLLASSDATPNLDFEPNNTRLDNLSHLYNSDIQIEGAYFWVTTDLAEESWYVHRLLDVFEFPTPIRFPNNIANIFSWPGVVPQYNPRVLNIFMSWLENFESVASVWW